MNSQDFGDTPWLGEGLGEVQYPPPVPEMLGSAESIKARRSAVPSEQEQYVQMFMHTVRGAIRIPAGAKATPCRKCPEVIFFSGKQPVSIKKYKEQPEGLEPTDDDDGCGISHYANCPKASEFRGKQ
jgi:hypothetical protein